MFRLLALLVLLLAVAPSKAEHVCRYCQAAAEGPADWSNPPQYAPDRVVDVLHLKIDVTPNFGEKTVRATTTVRFKPIARPTREVKLDAFELRIEDVTATRPLAEHSSTDEDLTLLFEEPIPVGEEVEVAITYECEPKKGLYFRTADMGYPEGEDHIWTQGETHEARHWYPAFDYPNEKSTTEVICHVPEAMTVLSNGTRIGEQSEADGMKAVHWIQKIPHANYLVCLVAGHFEKLSGERNGVQLGFYTQQSLIDHAPNAFQDTAEILAFFEEEIGVKYPWAKYDQVTINDFNWGGMENTSLTTLTNGTVYSDATENLRQAWGLDAHEFAHQWFGDYVTCKDWSHLWLNEGFATYYTHLYAEHKLGRDEMLYRLHRDAVGRVLPGTEKSTRPIVFNRYKVAWEQFDWRAYPKGSWVLHMLRCRFGEDLYREAIKVYLQRHALKSVVTDDLRQAFEEVTGEPLDAFFDQWVYYGGAPQVTVSHKWLAEDKLLKVTIKQGEPKPGETLLFTFPVTLRAHIGDRKLDRRVEVTEQSQDFYLQLPGKPAVFRFDPEYTLLAEVEHKKPQAMLEKQLQLAGDVIGRVLAAKALGKKQNKKATDALAAALDDDDFYGVKLEAAKALGQQGTPEALESLLARREQTDARVREQVVKELGEYFEDRAAGALTDIAKSDENPQVRGAALRGLAKYGAGDGADAIVEALRSESLHNHLAVSAAEAIGRRADPELGPALIAALKERRYEIPGRRYGQAIVAVGRAYRDAGDKTPAREFLCACLDDQAVGVRMGAIEGLGELADGRARPILADFARKAGRLKSAAEKALKRLDSVEDDAPKAVRDLREELRELRDDQKELRAKLEELEGIEDAD